MQEIRSLWKSYSSFKCFFVTLTFVVNFDQISRSNLYRELDHLYKCCLVPWKIVATRVHTDNKHTNGTHQHTLQKPKISQNNKPLVNKSILHTISCIYYTMTLNHISNTQSTFSVHISSTKTQADQISIVIYIYPIALGVNVYTAHNYIIHTTTLWNLIWNVGFHTWIN